MMTKDPKSLAAEARLLAGQIFPLLVGCPHARLLNDLADSLEYLSSLESSWEQTGIALATMRNDLGAMRQRAEVAEAEMQRLQNELGSAQHAATVATIGHEQLNRMIAIVDGAGYRGVYLEEGARRMARELADLRGGRTAGHVGISHLLAIAERFPPGAEHFIEHDGFRGRVVGYYQTEEGKPGVALQLVNARVVHVYGTKWLGE